mmetsp:Transcript_10381/g.21813  ORF Transcript_10381/g.21813 Transcript_10381/m.21813 type:complete len:80 (+) Transcript_10381:214-453(+)
MNFMSGTLTQILSAEGGMQRDNRHYQVPSATPGNLHRHFWSVTPHQRITESFKYEPKNNYLKFDWRSLGTSSKLTPTDD